VTTLTAGADVHRPAPAGPVWMVVCPPHDTSGLWAYRGLHNRLDGRVELITPEQLVCATRMVQRIGSGHTSVELGLTDGRTFSSDHVAGVLNRMRTVPTAHIAHAAPTDRDYAAGEWTALVVSMMSSLPNVINRAHPLGLSGHSRHISDWTELAQRAGLPTVSYRHGTPRLRVGPVEWTIVFDSAVYGMADYENAVIRLGKASGTRLLGVGFVTQERERRFAGATPLPDLRVGGEPLVDALADAFNRERSP
jgi:hypothetical protein